MIDKAARLQMLKEIGRRHAEREALIITALPEPTKHDIAEEVGVMDTFREAQRDEFSVNGAINSDERR